MNKRIVVASLCVGMFSVQALGRSPQTSANEQPGGGSALSAGTKSASKIDPAKEAAIRQLFNVMGTTAAINQIQDGMQQNMKTTLSRLLPPGDYQEKLIDLFFERFRSKLSPQHFLDLATQIYDKYLSIDDIQGLTQFYSTPLGKKTTSVLPQVMIEMQTESIKLGESVGRQAMGEILTEHPELAKALEDASKQTAPGATR